MKVQHIPHQYLQQNKNNEKQNTNQQFKGLAEIAAASTMGLRFLETNQAIGANSVDLCAMVIPRTAYDFSTRGPEAGIETGRRESMGTFNHSMVGVYGTLGGMLVAAGMNAKFNNLRADKLCADNITTDILANNWHNVLKNNETNPVRTYLNNIFDSVRIYNPSQNPQDGWVKIGNEEKELVVNKLEDLLKNGTKSRIDDEAKSYIKTIITSATGGENNVRLDYFENNKLVKSSQNTLNTLIENIHNVSKVFMRDDITEIFKNSLNVDSNSFVKALKHMNIKRSIIGLGIATGVGMATQPINKYLTYKKTGQTGFVGVEGREEDRSAKFKIMKGLAAALFAVGALSTITTKPSEFLGKIQFKGMLPTINQLKLVYGMTIASRFLAARDKDELRESAVKDTLGFLNLLVLGALVSKGTAKLLDKSKELVTMSQKDGKGFFNWLGKSSLKTRDEVLLSELKKYGIETIKDGKAISFKELLKLTSKLPVEAQKALKGKLNVLSISQIIGYVYSGLVLGLGVPALNAHMTAKSDAKYKAIAEAKKQANNNSAVQNFSKQQVNEFAKKYI